MTRIGLTENEKKEAFLLMNFVCKKMFTKPLFIGDSSKFERLKRQKCFHSSIAGLMKSYKD